MAEGRESPVISKEGGKEKGQMLRAQQWVLEHAGDRFGFSPEEATESLAILIRHQNSFESLLNTVENEKNSEEKKKKLIRGLEELTTALNQALSQLKELR
jgi:hypothetical protein